VLASSARSAAVLLGRSAETHSRYESWALLLARYQGSGGTSWRGQHMNGLSRLPSRQGLRECHGQGQGECPL
jgi:hypothetical protein